MIKNIPIIYPNELFYSFICRTYVRSGVGSSKELKSRLREHCDDKPKGPYAMHIGSWKNWLTLEKLKDGQIKILKLENQNEYFPDQIQFYEDVLWDYYKPLLGRRGSK